MPNRSSRISAQGFVPVIPDGTVIRLAPKYGIPRKGGKFSIDSLARPKSGNYAGILPLLPSPPQLVEEIFDLLVNLFRLPNHKGPSWSPIPNLTFSSVSCPSVGAYHLLNEFYQFPSIFRYPLGSSEGPRFRIFG